MKSRLPTVLATVSILGIAAAMGAIFLYVPTEREMGPVQRIFYIHVPSALSAYLAFFTVLVGSVQYLRTRQDRWDRLAASAAELGVMFSIIVLLTGPLWAQPIWGVWWRWEPRLTAMLITFTTYIAYLIIRAYGDQGPQTKRLSAVLGVIAFANVPFVYYAVRLWAPEQQLHPQNVELAPAMRQTLNLCYIAFFFLFFWLLHLRCALARDTQTLESLSQRLESVSPTLD
jgi:heme exporter protein C